MSLYKKQQLAKNILIIFDDLFYNLRLPRNSDSLYFLYPGKPGSLFILYNSVTLRVMYTRNIIKVCFILSYFIYNVWSNYMINNY